MTRARIIWSAVVVLLAAVGVWVASHTYWADTKVPMPPKGEALTNPMYAAQRLAAALGARTTRDRVFTVPELDAVVVLSGWHWSLVRTRREALEHWVESGGRLVVDSLLVSSGDDFERWSGVDWKYKADDEWKLNGERCRAFREEPGDLSRGVAPTRFSICDAAQTSSLFTSRPILWALRDASGVQALRVAVGRGTVTVINATPFRYQSLFEGDHGWLFVAATDLRRGDEMHFLSEDDSPKLLALVWRSGTPVVVLGLLAIALLMWRGAVRLGPLVVPAPAERRSLAEQIRGTGEFALRHGGGQALHAASVRALEEAARRRVPAYAGLSDSDRGVALERLSGFNANDLLTAAYHPNAPGLHQLRNALAVIEAARRHMIVRLKRS
jgi:hypothetical protein